VPALLAQVYPGLFDYAAEDAWLGAAWAWRGAQVTSAVSSMPVSRWAPTRLVPPCEPASFSVIGREPLRSA
jgi:hypothetical protein